MLFKKLLPTLAFITAPPLLALPATAETVQVLMKTKPGRYHPRTGS